MIQVGLLTELQKDELGVKQLPLIEYVPKPSPSPFPPIE
jgi:hypothetical protein